MSPASEAGRAANGLALRDVKVRYRDAGSREIVALAVPALDVAAGEQIGVSGPSGSGKSTLLHVIAGLVAPASGTLLWQGRDLAALSAAARDAWRRDTLGYVFQDFHLIPELDALANILLPASFARTNDLAARRRSALELAARLGIATLDRPTATLSRGEQQRVAVARALVHRPALVLADEPTASLDKENAASVGAALVEGAAAIGALLICVSHDAALLARFDRRLECSGGALGTPAEQAA